MLEQAQKHPHKFCIGVDACAEAMAESAHKAIRQKLPNVLFLAANVETLPAELSGIADEITINYPWGSLLQALVEPNTRILKNIVQLAKPKAILAILFNYSVLRDIEYCKRLKLPAVTEAEAKMRWEFAYKAAGIELKSLELLTNEVPHRTTWGIKLIKGSARETLMLRAIILSRP